MNAGEFLKFLKVFGIEPGGSAGFDPASPGPIGGATPSTVTMTKSTINAGTHTSGSDRVSNESVTWNAPGQNMVASESVITDTSSAAMSYHKVYTTGSASVFAVTKSGAFGRPSNGALTGDMDGFSITTNGRLNVLSQGNVMAMFESYQGLLMDSAAFKGVGVGPAFAGALNKDVCLYRKAAGEWEVTNGAAGAANRRDLYARNLAATQVMQLGALTVATLPAAASWTGGNAFVTDALAPAIGAAVAGGGAALAVVRSNGTNWIVTEVI